MSPGVEPKFLVRTKAIWELIEPAAPSPRPSHRTGHVMVSYGDKLVVCVTYSHMLVQSVTQVEWAALVERILNTITTTLGHSKRRPARGQSFIASALSHHPGKGILRRWWMMLSTCTVDGVSMERTWATWVHSRYRVRTPEISSPVYHNELIALIKSSAAVRFIRSKMVHVPKYGTCT